MSKLVRKLMAQELGKTIADLDCFILVSCERMDAEQAYLFRKKLRESKIAAKVLKNKLAGIAFKDVCKQNLKGMLKGPITMVYGGESPVELAKVITEWTKKHSKMMRLHGGYLSGQLLQHQDIEELSNVPPREVMLSLMAGALVSPMQAIATILNGAMQNFSNALGSLNDKLEKEAPKA